MKLYGSTTSPYVRRLRLYLHGKEFEFQSVNIFGSDRAKIKSKNPTLKVPMFEDESNSNLPVLVDSNIIYEYLADKYGAQPFTWAQKNLMTHINSCTESLVNSLILTRSGFDMSDDVLYFNIQRERCQAVFEVLEQAVKNGDFDDWNYVTISLISLLEWALFRQLFDFTDFPELMAFLAKMQQRPDVQATAPKE